MVMCDFQLMRMIPTVTCYITTAEGYIWAHALHVETVLRPASMHATGPYVYVSYSIYTAAATIFTQPWLFKYKLACQ